MSNPLLNDRVLKSSFNSLDNSETTMTASGTLLKTCLLSVFTSITFAYTWYLQLTGFADKALLLSKLGLFGGITLVFFISFAPKNKSLFITTPLYALCEGLILGYISVIANSFYPGVASQSILGTLFSVFGMYILYSTKIIKCTDKFRSIIYNSTFAIFGIYLVQFVLQFFHIQIPYLFSNSPIGILFSVAVIAIASFYLIVDFDNIEKFSNKADKHYEWYFAFSLLVTIIWLYVEILNLLMKLRSRN